MPSAIPPPFVMLEPGQVDPQKQPRRPGEEAGRKAHPTEETGDKPTLTDPKQNIDALRARINDKDPKRMWQQAVGI